MDWNLTCPYCRGLLDDHAAVDPEAREIVPADEPAAGQVAVCGHCGELAIYDLAGRRPRLRPLTPDEHIELSADDLAWGRIEEAQRYVQEHSPTYDHDRRRS